MKTAISIPDPVFEAAEELAKRLGKSRSQFYSEAVARYVEQQSETAVTERLNAIYGAEPQLSKLDPIVEALQWRSLPKEEW
jgi:antitoxin MazE6